MASQQPSEEELSALLERARAFLSQADDETSRQSHDPVTVLGPSIGSDAAAFPLPLAAYAPESRRTIAA